MSDQTNDQYSGSRVFVSFAMPDADLAKALVNFLRLGCDLSDQQVFMTARPGTLPPGTQFIEAIREVLDEAAMAVLLLTPSYYESRFCLAEAGAVWVQEKVHVPLIVPPVDFADLEGVQLGEQASRINSPSDLDAVRDLIADVLGKKVPTGSWNEHKDEFLNRWTADFEGSVASPEKVPAESYATLQEERNQLTHEIEDLRSEQTRLGNFVRQLRAQNEQLRSLVPAAPEPPELEGDETAQYIDEALSAIELAKKKVRKLPDIAREALYLHFHDAQPLTVGGYQDRFDIAIAQKNVEDGYLKWDEDQDQLVTIRHEQPEVEEAEAALDQVREIVFDGTSYQGRSKAGDWIKPVLKNQFGIDDPTFELRPVWESLGFL